MMTPDTYRKQCQYIRQAYELGVIDRIKATERMNQSRSKAYDAITSNEIDPSTKIKWAGISLDQVDETALLDI